MEITIEQKKEILEIIEKLKEEIIEYAEIDSEGYPHSPYISGFSADDIIEDKIIDILKVVKIEDDLDTTLAIKDIIEMIANNEIIPDDVDEFEEEEVIDDYDRESKYCYVTSIYKYKPSGTFHAFEEQWLQDKSDSSGELTYIGETKKKEKVIINWDY